MVCSRLEPWKWKNCCFPYQPNTYLLLPMNAIKVMLTRTEINWELTFGFSYKLWTWFCPGNFCNYTNIRLPRREKDLREMQCRYLNSHWNFHTKNIANTEMNSILGRKGALTFLVRRGCPLLDTRAVSMTALKTRLPHEVFQKEWHLGVKQNQNQIAWQQS